MDWKEGLRRCLKTLQNEADRAVNEDGFSEDVQVLRILEELIKEQSLYEDSCDPTGTKR